MRENQMPSAAVGRRLGMMGDVAAQHGAAMLRNEVMMSAVPGPPVAKPVEDMLSRFNYLLGRIQAETTVIGAVADRIVGPEPTEPHPEDRVNGGPLLLQLHDLLESLERAATRLERQASRLNSVV